MTQKKIGKNINMDEIFNEDSVMYNSVVLDLLKIIYESKCGHVGTFSEEKFSIAKEYSIFFNVSVWNAGYDGYEIKTDDLRNVYRISLTEDGKDFYKYQFKL